MNIKTSDLNLYEDSKYIMFLFFDLICYTNIMDSTWIELWNKSTLYKYIFIYSFTKMKYVLKYINNLKARAFYFTHIVHTCD